MIQILNRRCFLLSATALTLIIVLTSPANAQRDKKKKNKNDVQVPIPTELKITQPPPPPPANGSLYTPEAAGPGLVSDFKARCVGDLVFIQIVETSTATVESDANRKRDSGTLGGLVGLVGALPVPGAVAASTVAGGLGTRKFEGKGSSGRQSDLHARIAARVVEVLPNGDMRVAAEKFVKINKEDERLSLSGIVRPRDVSSDNIVGSTFVGDLKLAINGKGVASQDNSPGWIWRLLDKISPF